MAKKVDSSQMRCLAIQQPWAWAVCAGLKTFENRTRSTPYRGQIAILASSTRRNVKDLVARYPHLELDSDYFTYGAIIGVADLVDVVEMNDELLNDAYATGPLCWVFENARLLPEPIPANGQLNLYSLTEDLSAAVRAQLPNLVEPQLSEEDEFHADVVHHHTIIQKAWHMYHEDEYKEALEWFDIALEQLPGFVFAVLGRAQCLLALEDPEVMNYSQTLIDDKEYTVLGYLLRVRAYQQQGDVAKAEADYRRALAISEEDVTFYEQLLDATDPNAQANDEEEE